ncbi:MAG TPA: glutaredoxin family protein [Anaerolineales bacterium]|nr:glutaredoxin family protein [Anaerolineales bacterium]
MFTRQPARTYGPAYRSNVPVVVYGTGWCAASQMVRRYLDRLGVPYIYRDMEYDRTAARQVQWWTGGSSSHPTVQIGGQILVEPTLDELDWALSRVGIL